MAYSPDGDHLAIGTRDEVFVWNLRDERPLGRIPGGASALAFFPDGERLAVASRHGVWVYELDPPQPVLELEDHGAALAVSPDGHLLATSDRRGVTVRETGNWSVLHRLSGASGPLAFAPDGETLATGSRDGITLWSMGGSGGNVVLEDSPAGTRGPFPGGGSVVFSPDGGVVIAPLRPKLAGGEFALGCWDAHTGRERASLPADADGDGHTGLISGLAVDRSGELLVTGSWDHSVRLWDLESGRLLRTLLGHRGEVWSAAIAPDGAFVASGGKGGEVKIWPVREPRPTDAINGRWKPLRISRDGRYVVALDREGSLSILNLRSCAVVNSVELSAMESRFGRSAVSLSADLVVLAEGRGDGTVRMRRFDDGEESSFRVSENGVEFVALSPGAGELVAGGRREGLSWWDLSDPSLPLIRLPGSFAVFSEDGGSLVVMEREGAAVVYDTALRSVRARIENAGRSFGATVAISPGGELLALTHGFEDFENAVSLWDTASGERVGTLTGHKQAIWSVAFSPDGRTLATSSGDGTVRLWSVASRRELLALGEPGLALDDLLFSPDGRVLVGGAPGFAAEGELRIFRAPRQDSPRW